MVLENLSQEFLHKNWTKGGLDSKAKRKWNCVKDATQCETIVVDTHR
jgi:hypothetical protein